MKTLTHRIMQCLVPAPLRSASTYGPQGPARRLRQRGFALGQALVVTAVLEESADLVALRQRIETEALTHARQALGNLSLPAQLDLTITARRASRVA